MLTHSSSELLTNDVKMAN